MKPRKLTAAWYVAVLIVKLSVRGKKEKRPKYDRQIRVLRAATHEAAYKKALKLGKAENQSYQNAQGKTVSWRFVGLGNLDRMSESRITDGQEIYFSLQRGNPEKEVRPKRELTVFWYEANKHKRIHELLGENRPYAAAF